MAAMIVGRHYSRAPIKEALIDIQVKAPSGVTLATLANICDSERECYPQRQDRHIFHGEVKVGTHVGATTSQQHLGYVAFSSTEHQAFQVRLDGFTFSRFEPYDSWTPFQAEAKRLWSAYRDAVKPEAVTRIAVRYINRFDLPVEVKELGKYLTALPVLPAISTGVSQQPSGFLVQLQIPQDDIGCVLELVEALIPPVVADSTSVLLDIDLYREVQGAVSEGEIWILLGQLHDRKNEVFEACITDEAREVIA
ncbi:MAG: TIGR04255 family protein [Dehalococcoidia bacterium]